MEIMSFTTMYFLISHVKKNFNEIDVNKDGYIAMDELSNALEDDGIEFEAELKQFFDHVDINKDGKLFDSVWMK